MSQIKNKVALITGASDGIGEAIALQMLKLGYKVILDNGNFNSGYCILEDEKVIVINKNNNPPIHCELDLHNTRGSSILLISFKIENPVAVNPDTDSKYESSILIL